MDANALMEPLQGRLDSVFGIDRTLCTYAAECGSGDFLAKLNATYRGVRAENAAGVEAFVFATGDFLDVLGDKLGDPEFWGKAVSDILTGSGIVDDTGFTCVSTRLKPDEVSLPEGTRVLLGKYMIAASEESWVFLALPLRAAAAADSRVPGSAYVVVGGSYFPDAAKGRVKPGVRLPVSAVHSNPSCLVIAETGRLVGYCEVLKSGDAWSVKITAIGEPVFGYLEPPPDAWGMMVTTGRVPLDKIAPGTVLPLDDAGEFRAVCTDNLILKGQFVTEGDTALFRPE